MDWTKDSVANNDKTPRLSDSVDMLELGTDFKEVRMIGPSRRVMRHWLEITTKGGKETRLPKMCLAWDEDKGEFNGTCPYCDIDPKTARLEIHTNAIDREIQENKPGKARPPSDTEKKVVEMLGYKCRVKKHKSSKTWTPARYWVIRPSAGTKISDYTKLNKKKLNGEVKIFGPEHSKFGFDLQVKFDGSRSPADQYGIVKGDATAIEEDERRILLWDLTLEQPEELKVAKVEAARLKKQLTGAKDDEDEDDDDDDDKKKSKSKGSKEKSKKKPESDNWDEDEDFEDDDDDKPKKKKKKPAADEDDDDEDEPRSKKSSKSKKRPADDDDDDDSDDDDDDANEDEEDEPRRGKSKKSSGKVAPKKKKPVDEDEEDWDEDEEEEDEAPKRKSSKKPVEKSSKKRRPVDDDDDDDDSDEDEDEDEDEKPARSKKKAPVKSSSKKASSKKRSSKDDDDDDDDDSGDWDDDDDDD